MINDTFVPGNTAIYAPMHTIFRGIFSKYKRLKSHMTNPKDDLDPRNFERPKEFLPERWYKTSKYPLTRDQKVFIPFWTGNFYPLGPLTSILESIN